MTLTTLPIDFKIYDPDYRDRGGEIKGFKIVTIEAYANNKKVGYIKLSYVPNKVWEDRFENDILHYVRHWSGWCFDEETLSGLPSYVLPYGTENDDVKNFLEIARKKAYELKDGDRQSSRKFHVDKPLVDYIHVDEDERRKGYGTQLYFRAAQWCQENDMEMYASGIQSNQAQGVWKKMETMSECVIQSRGERKVLLINS